MKSTAKYVQEITVTDPDTQLPVEIALFKHENGGMFAIDSSYIEQVFEDERNVIIKDPLNKNGNVLLMGV